MKPGVVVNGWEAPNIHIAGFADCEESLDATLLSGGVAAMLQIP